MCFLLLVCGLAAQQPRDVSGAATQLFDGPGGAFRFGKADLRLLDDANHIDTGFDEKGFVFHDPGVQAYIDSIGARILGNRRVPEKVIYRFMVLRSSQVNAFSLCNGSVYITTGLLALLQNEAQLAAVIGHETAHVYERHGYLENRRAGHDNLAAEIFTAAAGAIPGGYGLGAIAGEKVSTVLLEESIYGYAREMERQADRDGIEAMIAAGYNPNAMAAEFDRLDRDATLEYEPRSAFYQDHPELKEREKAAADFADKNTPSNARTGSEQDYLTAVAPAIADSIENDLESRKLRTAAVRATRLVHAFPEVPQYQMLLGESYRELGAKSIEPTAEELTQQGEKEQRKLVLKMTGQQEQQKLLSTPNGRATLQQNQAAAEKAFLAVVHEQPDDALVYRELGFLYEDEARYSDAAANYRHYLQLMSSTSLDRYRIERRLAALENRQTGGQH